jgi:hypothetical protein
MNGCRVDGGEEGVRVISYCESTGDIVTEDGEVGKNVEGCDKEIAGILMWIWLLKLTIERWAMD